jgi:outer membrane lipoprotein LolB
MFASGASLHPNKSSRPLALICAISLLAGCASRPVTQLPELTDWQVRQEVLGAVRDWEFSGRIAVSAGEEGFNGKLRWAQKDDNFQATVSGPLGIGTVRIEGDGESAVLTDKEGVRTELQNVEQELLYRYGWTIPVKSLRYWALGIPDPSELAFTDFDEQGLLTSLEQGNWHVQIPQYREGSGQMMPRRLTAVSGDNKVRLVIDSWTFR